MRLKYRPDAVYFLEDIICSQIDFIVSSSIFLPTPSVNKCSGSSNLVDVTLSDCEIATINHYLDQFEDKVRPSFSKSSKWVDEKLFASSQCILPREYDSLPRIHDDYFAEPSFDNDFGICSIEEPVVLDVQGKKFNPLQIIWDEFPNLLQPSNTLALHRNVKAHYPIPPGDLDSCCSKLKLPLSSSQFQIKLDQSSVWEYLRFDEEIKRNLDEDNINNKELNLTVFEGEVGPKGVSATKDESLWRGIWIDMKQGQIESLECHSIGKLSVNLHKLIQHVSSEDISRVLDCSREWALERNSHKSGLKEVAAFYKPRVENSFFEVLGIRSYSKKNTDFVVEISKEIEERLVEVDLCQKSGFSKDDWTIQEAKLILSESSKRRDNNNNNNNNNIKCGKSNSLLDQGKSADKRELLCEPITLETPIILPPPKNAPIKVTQYLIESCKVFTPNNNKNNNNKANNGPLQLTFSYFMSSLQKTDLIQPPENLLSLETDSTKSCISICGREIVEVQNFSERVYSTDTTFADMDVSCLPVPEIACERDTKIGVTIKALFKKFILQPIPYQVLEIRLLSFWNRTSVQDLRKKLFSSLLIEFEEKVNISFDDITSKEKAEYFLDEYNFVALARFNPREKEEAIRKITIKVKKHDTIEVENRVFERTQVIPSPDQFHSLQNPFANKLINSSRSPFKTDPLQITSAETIYSSPTPTLNNLNLSVETPQSSPSVSLIQQRQQQQHSSGQSTPDLTQLNAPTEPSIPQTTSSQLKTVRNKSVSIKDYIDQYMCVSGKIYGKSQAGNPSNLLQFPSNFSTNFPEYQLNITKRIQDKNTLVVLPPSHSPLPIACLAILNHLSFPKNRVMWVSFTHTLQTSFKFCSNLTKETDLKIVEVNRNSTIQSLNEGQVVFVPQKWILEKLSEITYSPSSSMPPLFLFSMIVFETMLGVGSDPILMHSDYRKISKAINASCNNFSKPYNPPKLLILSTYPTSNSKELYDLACDYSLEQILTRTTSDPDMIAQKASKPGKEYTVNLSPQLKEILFEIENEGCVVVDGLLKLGLLPPMTHNVVNRNEELKRIFCSMEPDFVAHLIFEMQKPSKGSDKENQDEISVFSFTVLKLLSELSRVFTCYGVTEACHFLEGMSNSLDPQIISCLKELADMMWTSRSEVDAGLYSDHPKMDTLKDVLKQELNKFSDLTTTQKNHHHGRDSPSFFKVLILLPKWYELTTSMIIQALEKIPELRVTTLSKPKDKSNSKNNNNNNNNSTINNISGWIDELLVLKGFNCIVGAISDIRNISDFPWTKFSMVVEWEKNWREVGGIEKIKPSLQEGTNFIQLVTEEYSRLENAVGGKEDSNYKTDRWIEALRSHYFKGAHSNGIYDKVVDVKLILENGGWPANIFNSVLLPPQTPQQKPIQASKSCSSPLKTSVERKKDLISITIIAGDKIINNHEIIHELEAVQKITIIERSLPQNAEDLILDPQTCLLWYELDELLSGFQKGRKKSTDSQFNEDNEIQKIMVEIFKRLAVISHRYERCHVILYSKSKSKGSPFQLPNPLDKILHSVIGSLVHYPIEIAFHLSLEGKSPAASLIRQICHQTAALSEHSLETWASRDMLTDIETNHERFLCSIPNVNSFIAQSLLHWLPLSDLMSCERNEFSKHPLLPSKIADRIYEVFHQGEKKFPQKSAMDQHTRKTDSVWNFQQTPASRDYYHRPSTQNINAAEKVKKLPNQPNYSSGRNSRVNEQVFASPFSADRVTMRSNNSSLGRNNKDHLEEVIITGSKTPQSQNRHGNTDTMQYLETFRFQNNRQLPSSHDTPTNNNFNNKIRLQTSNNNSNKNIRNRQHSENIDVFHRSGLSSSQSVRSTGKRGCVETQSSNDQTDPTRKTLKNAFLKYMNNNEQEHNEGDYESISNRHYKVDRDRDWSDKKEIEEISVGRNNRSHFSHNSRQYEDNNFEQDSAHSERFNNRNEIMFDTTPFLRGFQEQDENDYRKKRRIEENEWGGFGSGSNAFEMPSAREKEILYRKPQTPVFIPSSPQSTKTSSFSFLQSETFHPLKRKNWDQRNASYSSSGVYREGSDLRGPNEWKPKTFLSETRENYSWQNSNSNGNSNSKNEWSWE